VPTRAASGGPTRHGEVAGAAPATASRADPCQPPPARPRGPRSTPPPRGSRPRNGGLRPRRSTWGIAGPFADTAPRRPREAQDHRLEIRCADRDQRRAALAALPRFWRCCGDGRRPFGVWKATPPTRKPAKRPCSPPGTSPGSRGPTTTGRRRRKRKPRPSCGAAGRHPGGDRQRAPQEERRAHAGLRSRWAVAAWPGPHPSRSGAAHPSSSEDRHRKTPRPSSGAARFVEDVPALPEAPNGPGSGRIGPWAAGTTAGRGNGGPRWP